MLYDHTYHNVTTDHEMPFLFLGQGPRQHGFLGSQEPIDFEKMVPGTHQFLTKHFMRMGISKFESDLIIIMKSFISDPEQVGITIFQSYIHLKIHFLLFLEYILWQVILWNLSGSVGAKSPQKRGHCCLTPIPGFENQPNWQITKSFQNH